MGGRKTWMGGQVEFEWVDLGGLAGQVDFVWVDRCIWVGRMDRQGGTVDYLVILVACKLRFVQSIIYT